MCPKREIGESYTFREVQNQLKLTTKQTYEHVHANSYSLAYYISRSLDTECKV